MPSITRRAALVAGASLPLAGLARPGLGQDNPMIAENAVKHGFMLGDMEVSTLLAGTRTVEEPQGTFGTNVSPEEFAEVSAANFIPIDLTRFYFTPTVVNTGSEVVLFDAGLTAEGTLAALEQAGYAADDVTVVILTHMHGDHIGGLSHEDGTPTFANARYVTGQVEFDHWAGQANEGFEAKVRPLTDNMTFIGEGESPVAGITGKRVLGMLAAERMPFIGYHMPFPATGYVEDLGDGRFRYVAASYQLTL
jgi:glyoxylase-like metal-dependent hydrolase (beta-lactamase superfamily II)